MTNLRVRPYKRMFLFFPAYFAAYALVESFVPAGGYHVMHCALDDMIPFCELFVIPYIGWIVLSFWLGGYTFFREPEEFHRLIQYYIVASIICFAIILIYPSCQELRPETFANDRFLTRLVRGLYTTDTPTNVFPSMHVAGALGSLFCMMRIKFFETPKMRAAAIILIVLICVSTLFIKQHSVLDLLGALPVGIIGWIIVYGRKNKKRSA